MHTVVGGTEQMKLFRVCFDCVVHSSRGVHRQLACTHTLSTLWTILRRVLGPPLSRGACQFKWKPQTVLRRQIRVLGEKKNRLQKWRSFDTMWTLWAPIAHKVHNGRVVERDMLFVFCSLKALIKWHLKLFCSQLTRIMLRGIAQKKSQFTFVLF